MSKSLGKYKIATGKDKWLVQAARVVVEDKDPMLKQLIVIYAEDQRYVKRGLKAATAVDVEGKLRDTTALI